MNPVNVILVGAGNRGNVYARYALEEPEKMQIVGVVDPNDIRRNKAKKDYNIGAEHCYKSFDDFILADKFAEAVINATMDEDHVLLSIQILEKGYDLLLEKPYAISEEEAKGLVKVANDLQRKVMICHVLRYAPFYSAIKERILDGDVGEITSIQTTEHVSFHHMAVSYVRGKWRNEKLCHSSMLLAKSCHDLDLIMWMNAPARPLAVSSFGGRHFFRKDKAPKNAGSRCLVDCPIEESCNYSCKKHYIDHPNRWAQYVWAELEHIDNPTIEDKIKSLETSNHYGRCVWDYDNDVVDRQSVNIEFDNGSIATHTMLGGAAKSQRYMHIVGSKGEIRGVFEDSKFTVRKIAPTAQVDYTEEIIDLAEQGDMTGAFGGHGGGDFRLVADFVHYVRNEATSISCTTIQDSLNSHLAAFLADRARLEETVVKFVNKVN